MANVKLNIAYLYLLQISQYLFPIMTVPMLSRALGIEGFGAVAVSTSFIMYFTVITEWGFNLSATQAIARARKSTAELRNAFWSTLLARIMLALPCVIGALALGWFVPALRSAFPLISIAVSQILGTAITVNWFLQGVERMSSFVLVSIIGRGITVPATFLLVHSPQDAGMAVAIQSASVLLIGLFGLGVALSRYDLLPLQVKPALAWRQLQEGVHLFASQFAVTLYSQSNVVLLGILAGPSAAGIFNGADRVRRAAQAGVGPISLALFPRISILAVDSPRHALRLSIRLLLLQGGVSLLISLVLFAGADIITHVLLGPKFAAVGQIIRLVAITPFMVGLNNILGTQILLPFNRKATFSSIIIACGLFNIGCLLALCSRFGAAGAALSVSATESLVTILMGLACYRLWRDVHSYPADPPLT